MSKLYFNLSICTSGKMPFLVNSDTHAQTLQPFLHELLDALRYVTTCNKCNEISQHVSQHVSYMSVRELHVSTWATYQYVSYMSARQLHVSTAATCQHLSYMSARELHVTTWATYQYVSYISARELHVSTWDTCQHVSYTSGSQVLVIHVDNLQAFPRERNSGQVQ